MNEQTAGGAAVLGLDFGTTNTVVALSNGSGSELVDSEGEEAAGPVFRSALCFWEDERGWTGIAHEAVPGCTCSATWASAIWSRST